MSDLSTKELVEGIQALRDAKAEWRARRQETYSASSRETDAKNKFNEIRKKVEPMFERLEKELDE